MMMMMMMMMMIIIIIYLTFWTHALLSPKVK